MRLYEVYPDYLDIGWLGALSYNRKLVARFCSIVEDKNYQPGNHTPSPQWEEWGKELAKL